MDAMVVSEQGIQFVILPFCKRYACMSPKLKMLHGAEQHISTNEMKETRQNLCPLASPEEEIPM